MNNSHCFQCDKELTVDEKALYMKLVSRNARQFLCLDCLAHELSCTKEALEKRIRYYRESGECVLFR